jgi:hypothetical protein
VAFAVVLVAVSPARRADETTTLERYADATWESFVAMTDPASGLALGRAPRGRRHRGPDLHDEHRRYMWSAWADGEPGGC